MKNLPTAQFFNNPDDPRHGTLNGYDNLCCRCDRCRRANADYQADYYRRHPEQYEKSKAWSRKQKALQRGYASHEEYVRARDARRDAKAAALTKLAEAIPSSSAEDLKVREIHRLLASGEARTLRQASHLSVIELASAIGCHPNSVYKWEGTDRLPEPYWALRLANVYDSLSA